MLLGDACTEARQRGSTGVCNAFDAVSHNPLQAPVVPTFCPLRLRYASHLSPTQDVLPALDTPREALTTAALLRLPRTLSRAQKLRRVEETLEVLELSDCADTQIGDAAQGARGLSGGQRRRVTSACLLWGGSSGVMGVCALQLASTRACYTGHG